MSLTSDLVTAWKSLRASRWTSIAAALILALGTGANVAVLAVAYAALWRPLPIHAPDRLVVISLGERDEVRRLIVKSKGRPKALTKLEARRLGALAAKAARAVAVRPKRPRTG